MCKDEKVPKIEKDAEINNTLNTYDEAADMTGNGRYSLLLLSTCCIISNAVALDLFGFGLVVATASCDLALSMEQKGLLSSIPFAGLLFAFPWGYFADTRGRRRALLWSTSVGFVFAALSSLSPTWHIMAALKFVGCSFSSAANSITMTYLAECTDSKHRSRYLQVMNSINLASEAVSFLLALIILPLSFNVPLPLLSISLRPWRLLTLLMSLPLGLGAVLMVYLHESPKFLASRGEGGKALEVMVDVFQRNGGRGEFPVKNLHVSKDADDQDGSFYDLIVSQTVPIFKPPLVKRTLQLFYLLVIICSTNNVFVMWFPTIVNSFFISKSEGVDSRSFCSRISNADNVTVPSSLEFDPTCNDSISDSTIYCGIAYGVFYTVLNLLIAQLSNRRLVLIITLAVSAASCTLVNLPDQPEVNLVFFALLQSTSICIGIAGSYFNDLFPTSCRALATSLGLMMGRVASFAGVNLVGAVINDYCQLTFYSWAVFVLSGVFVGLLLPSDKKIANTNVT